MENYNEKVLKLRVREKELTEQLEYWEQYPPVNNMGKWARQTKLDSLKEKHKSMMMINVIIMKEYILRIVI